jgi:PAS domain S-box-containing protein
MTELGGSYDEATATHPGATAPGPPIDAVLRLILNQMPAVMWATDVDLRFTRSEGGGLGGLGLEPGEVVGRDLFEFFGTADPSFPPIRAHLDALGGEPQRYELAWSDRTFLTHLEPLRALGGHIVGVVGVSIDITERARAETELRATVEALRQSEQRTRDLLSELVGAQEEEARRIAADLHDGPVQHMTAVGMRLHILALRSEDPAALAAIADAEEAVNRSVDEMRSLLFHLVPPDLDRVGLGATVGELLSRLREDTGAHADLDVDLAAHPPLPLAVTAYRVVQEALWNVRKHADARAVSVVLRSDGDALAVVVSDDGVGFDPATASSNGHVGLRGMRERARAAGGRLDVRSAVGRGTTVELEIPLRR